MRWKERRARQREAQRLWADKWPLGQIAKKMNVEPTTVHCWVDPEYDAHRRWQIRVARVMRGAKQ